MPGGVAEPITPGGIAEPLTQPSASADGGPGPATTTQLSTMPVPIASLLPAPTASGGSGLPQACPLGQQFCPNAGACKDISSDANYCGVSCARCGCGEAPPCNIGWQQPCLLTSYFHCCTPICPPQTLLALHTPPGFLAAPPACAACCSSRRQPQIGSAGTGAARRLAPAWQGRHWCTVNPSRVTAAPATAPPAACLQCLAQALWDCRSRSHPRCRSSLRCPL